MSRTRRDNWVRGDCAVEVGIAVEIRSVSVVRVVEKLRDLAYGVFGWDTHAGRQIDQIPRFRGV